MNGGKKQQPGIVPRVILAAIVMLSLSIFAAGVTIVAGAGWAMIATSAIVLADIRFSRGRRPHDRQGRE